MQHCHVHGRRFVGADNKPLAIEDAASVAPAAIQELNQMLPEELNRRDAENDALSSGLNARDVWRVVLDRRLAAVEERLTCGTRMISQTRIQTPA